MNFFEEMARKRESAIAREQQRVADRAYWEARAAEVREREKAERDGERRGRAELVSHLMTPGALGDMVMARARYPISITAADGKLPTRFCWMPKGTHELSCGDGFGGVWQGTVVCDEQAAAAVQASFVEITRDGWRPWIDIEHREGEAAGWVHGFSWDLAVGILVSVEWTSLGETAIRDRIFMSFSPSFLVNNDTGRVAGIRANAAAGALTNRPAFGLAMPPISAAGRHASADDVCGALIAAGVSVAAAHAVRDAVLAGADGRAAALVLQTVQQFEA